MATTFEDPLTVTSFSHPTTRSHRKSTKTIERVDCETIITDQAAMNLVTELRDQIETKESEVARLREALERDSEVDESKTPEELRRLQAAFDRVQRDCALRIDPVQRKLSEIISRLEGKRRWVHLLSELCDERSTAYQKLANAINFTLSEFDDPEVHPDDESCLTPTVKEGLAVQRDYDCLKFQSGFRSHSEQELHKLNRELTDLLRESDELKEKENRRKISNQKQIDNRCTRPKVVLIDDSWVDASRTFNHNLLLLQEVKFGIKLFSDEIGKVQLEIQGQHSNIYRLGEELIELQRFVPGETEKDKGAETRYEMTKLAAETDAIKVKIRIAEAKYKIDRDKLAELTKQLKRIARDVEALKGQLADTKKRREAADEQLERSQVHRADVMSRRVFPNDSKTTMEQRLREGRAKLRAMLEETEQLSHLLKKQELMIALSDELMALKKMNLQRVAGTVSSLLKINSDIETF
jgi:chromosome segregation ATPase